MIHWSSVPTPALDNASLPEGVARSSRTTSTPAGGANPAPTGGDQATLGSSVVGLTQRTLASPDVRAGVVAHFRAQIASGNYQVSSQNVADAMLADPQTGLGIKDAG